MNGCSSSRGSPLLEGFPLTQNPELRSWGCRVGGWGTVLFRQVSGTPAAGLTPQSRIEDSHGVIQTMSRPSWILAGLCRLGPDRADLGRGTGSPCSRHGSLSRSPGPPMSRPEPHHPCQQQQQRQCSSGPRLSCSATCCCNAAARGSGGPSWDCAAQWSASCSWGSVSTWQCARGRGSPCWPATSTGWQDCASHQVPAELQGELQCLAP